MIVDIATGVCLITGSFFALTAGVGILRMPDFYSRAHPAGKSDTLAQILIMMGLLLQALEHEIFGPHVGIKLLLVSVFLLMTGPTAVHAITKAAHVEGLKIWRRRG
ncbi:MAG TPA: monovalent cation/H(+) antiporter subunit G [Candidatus Binatia bacterium]